MSPILLSSLYLHLCDFAVPPVQSWNLYSHPGPWAGLPCARVGGVHWRWWSVACFLASGCLLSLSVPCWESRHGISKSPSTATGPQETVWKRAQLSSRVTWASWPHPGGPPKISSAISWPSADHRGSSPAEPKRTTQPTQGLVSKNRCLCFQPLSIGVVLKITTNCDILLKLFILSTCFLMWIMSNWTLLAFTGLVYNTRKSLKREDRQTEPYGNDFHCPL